MGLGYVSQVAILPAFAHARENSELVALLYGDAQKRKTGTRDYRVRSTYPFEGFADCLASGDVDAVYIGLPNNMHRVYAKCAAQAGIHILCEKPMAIVEQECAVMIEAASAGGAKLMIACRLHFEKGNLASIQAIQDATISEP